jgi:hypothetical protein
MESEVYLLTEQQSVKADTEEQEEKLEYKPGLASKKIIAEEVFDPNASKVSYWTRRIGSDGLKQVDQIIDEKTGVIYRPLLNEHVRKGLVLLPSRPIQCTFEQAFKDGTELALEIFDCPESQVQTFKLLIGIAQGSWFIDRFYADLDYVIAGMGMYAPLIAFRGRSGGGKKRAFNALRLNSYRPFAEKSAVRIPSLFRPLDLWRGSMFLDECDVQGDEANDLVQFINCRADGMPLSRQNPENPRVPQAFWSFGQTVVTQRRVWRDDATENRTLSFECEESEKPLPTVELNEWIEKAIQVQNELLYLRLMYWDKVVIDKKARIQGVKDHRLTASVLPLLALKRFAPSMVEDLEEILKEWERKKKEVRAMSKDGLVINAIWDYVSEGLFGSYGSWFYVAKQKFQNPLTKEDDYIPLATKDLEERLGISSAEIRRVIHSLQLSEIKGAPGYQRVRKTLYRPIWFTPYRLWTRIEDFVPQNESEIKQKLNELFPGIFPNSNSGGDTEEKPVSTVSTVSTPPVSTRPAERLDTLDTLDTVFTCVSPSNSNANSKIICDKDFTVSTVSAIAISNHIASPTPLDNAEEGYCSICKTNVGKSLIREHIRLLHPITST